MEVTPDWKPVALSAMHHVLVDLGAVMIESDGWQRPSRYTFVEDEVDRLRQAVGLLDISPDGKLSLQGDDIDSLLSVAFVDVSALEVGQVRRTSLAGGSHTEELLLARLADDEALVLSGPDKAAAVTRVLGQAQHDCAHAVDITSAMAGVKVTGRYARGLLSAVIEPDTSAVAFPDLTCVQVSVAQVHGILLRHDIGRLTNFDLYFGREYGEYMWDALIEAGRPHNVAPFGIEALALLQQEV